MKTSTKVILITIPFAVATFLLGNVIWPPSTDFGQPTAQQLPLLMGIAAIEAIAFGIGVSFLLLAWPHIKALNPGHKGLALAAYLSIAWMLVSWWPHDNMHINNGGDLWGIIAIDYAFHFTLILAGFITAYFFYNSVSGHLAAHNETRL